MRSQCHLDPTRRCCSIDWTRRFALRRSLHMIFLLRSSLAVQPNPGVEQGRKGRRNRPLGGIGGLGRRRADSDRAGTAGLDVAAADPRRRAVALLVIPAIQFAHRFGRYRGCEPRGDAACHFVGVSSSASPDRVCGAICPRRAACRPDLGCTDLLREFRVKPAISVSFTPLCRLYEKAPRSISNLYGRQRKFGAVKITRTRGPNERPF